MVGFFRGGAAGYRTRVRSVTWYSSTSLVRFKLFYNVQVAQNRPKIPPDRYAEKVLYTAAALCVASDINIAPRANMSPMAKDVATIKLQLRLVEQP